MRGARAACTLAAATWVVAAAGCHKPSSGTVDAAPAGGGGGIAEGGAAGGGLSRGVVAARCHPTGKGFALGSVGGKAGGLEVGGALPYPDGIAIALVREPPKGSEGRSVAVALLAPGPSDVRVVDLGRAAGDAPPPQLAWTGKELVAAAFTAPTTKPRAGDEDARALALYVVGGRPSPEPKVVVPQQRDDSFAYDLAYTGGAGASHGLLVWDEVRDGSGDGQGEGVGAKGVAATGAANGPRGVIRAVSLDAAAHAGPAQNVSPLESDAELPRVVAQHGGFFVLWIARRPAAQGTGEGGAELQASSEPPSYRWLEMARLDASGALAGDVQRLTPTTGHVSSYDVRHLAGSKPGLLVVARDDGEDVDGSGGTLLRVRVNGDRAEPPLAFPSDGLGPGAPALVGSPGPGPWLAWAGPLQTLRLLPLDDDGAPAALSSVEQGPPNAWPLLFVPPSPGGSPAAGPLLLMMATPDAPGAELRLYSCSR